MIKHFHGSINGMCDLVILINHIEDLHINKKQFPVYSNTSGLLVVVIFFSINQIFHFINKSESIPRYLMTAVNTLFGHERLLTFLDFSAF